MLRSRSARPQVIALIVLIAFLSVLALFAAGSVTTIEPVRPLDDPERLTPLAALPGVPTVDSDVGSATPAPVTGNDALSLNARQPFVAVGATARPFLGRITLQDRPLARGCLAAAMLYEAGPGDLLGQLAVGQVVLNRVAHPAFPGSVCGVVLQGSERKTGCQFTFTCDGSLARRYSATAIAGALARADRMLDGLVLPAVGLATHYHTQGVFPWWSPKLEKIAQVGPHLFFRWPGYWGSAGAGRGKRLAPEPAAPQVVAAGFLDRPAELGQERGQTVEPALRDLGAIRSLTPEIANANLTPGASVLVPIARRLAPPPSSAASPTAPMLTSRLLDGNRLVRMFPDEGVFFLEMNAASGPSGRKGAAQVLCGGRAVCHVYGWNMGMVPTAGPTLDRNAHSQIVFQYDVVPKKSAKAGDGDAISRGLYQPSHQSP